MWSRKFQSCQECGGTDVPHMAKGLCQRCYSATYAKDPKNAKRVKRQKHNWYKKQGEGYSKEMREQKHFEDRREAVLERDNHRCTQCGAEFPLVVHHNDGNGRGVHPSEANNDINNLVTLCRACHIKVHDPHGWRTRDRNVNDIV